jgi:hypothetical protein
MRVELNVLRDGGDCEAAGREYSCKRLQREPEGIRDFVHDALDALYCSFHGPSDNAPTGQLVENIFV